MLQPTESYKLNTKSYSKKCTLSSKRVSMINISLSRSLQHNISALEREYCYRNRKNKTKIFEIKKELEERRIELAIMKAEKTRTNSERNIPTLSVYGQKKHFDQFAKFELLSGSKRKSYYSNLNIPHITAQRLSKEEGSRISVLARPKTSVSLRTPTLIKKRPRTSTCAERRSIGACIC